MIFNIFVSDLENSFFDFEWGVIGSGVSVDLTPSSVSLMFAQRAMSTSQNISTAPVIIFPWLWCYRPTFSSGRILWKHEIMVWFGNVVQHVYVLLFLCIHASECVCVCVCVCVKSQNSYKFVCINLRCTLLCVSLCLLSVSHFLSFSILALSLSLSLSLSFLSLSQSNNYYFIRWTGLVQCQWSAHSLCW